MEKWGALACVLNGLSAGLFQSGHMPGMWARFPVGGVQQTTTHRGFSLSLSPFLPLSKNKLI